MGSDGYFAGLAWLGVLVLLRVGPIVLLTPAFGGPVVPRRFRIALAICLTLTLVVQLTPPAVLPSTPQLIGLAVKELVLGVTLATVITLVFDTFAMAGSLIDQFRGASLSDAIDPTGGEQTSSLAVFYKLLALVLFLSAGGYSLLLRAIADGLQFLPPMTMPPVVTSGIPAVSDVLLFFGRLFVLAVQISAPMLLLGVMIDVALALLGRLASLPGVEAFGPQLKAPLGVLVCLLSLAAAVSRVPEVLTEMLSRIATGGGAGR